MDLLHIFSPWRELAQSRIRRLPVDFENSGCRHVEGSIYCWNCGLFSALSLVVEVFKVGSVYSADGVRRSLQHLIRSGYKSMEDLQMGRLQTSRFLIPGPRKSSHVLASYEHFELRSAVCKPDVNHCPVGRRWRYGHLKICK